jgi:hypothetical protein
MAWVEVVEVVFSSRYESMASVLRSDPAEVASDVLIATLQAWMACAWTVAQYRVLLVELPVLYGSNRAGHPLQIVSSQPAATATAMPLRCALQLQTHTHQHGMLNDTEASTRLAKCPLPQAMRSLLGRPCADLAPLLAPAATTLLSRLHIAAAGPGVDPSSSVRLPGRCHRVLSALLGLLAAGRHMPPLRLQLYAALLQFLHFTRCVRIRPHCVSCSARPCPAACGC